MLRWLAARSYLDISIAHNQYVSSTYYHINKTLQAMNAIIKLSFPYRDKTWLADYSYKFSAQVEKPNIWLLCCT